MIRILLFCVLVCSGCPGQTVPDLLLVHGRLFGADANAHAIAIGGDRIVAIGTDDSILKMAGPATIVYDLAGRTVNPGFNDAHSHWMPRPVGMELTFSRMDPQWSEVVSAIQTAA